MCGVDLLVKPPEVRGKLVSAQVKKVVLSKNKPDVVFRVISTTSQSLELADYFYHVILTNHRIVIYKSHKSFFTDNSKGMFVDRYHSTYNTLTGTGSRGSRRRDDIRDNLWFASYSSDVLMNDPGYPARALQWVESSKTNPSA